MIPDSTALSNQAMPSNVLVKLGFSWPLIVGILAFVSVILNQNSLVLADPDSLMHITAGNWILNHHLVPLIDPFSFHTEGKTWIDHEWLAQVLWATAYNLGSFSGVKILTASLFAVTLALQLRYVLQYIPAIYGLLFSAICYLSLQGHLLARPHLMTWPIIIIWFGYLLNASSKRTSPPLFLLPLMVLWANLHGSFLLGLALTPVIAIDAIVGSSRAERISLLKSWTQFFVLAIFASLITPFFWRGWEFGITLMSSPYITRIIEWAPATGSAVISIEIWTMILLVFSLYGRVQFSLGRIILLLGILHESLAHIRYISIVGLLIPLLIAEPFGRAYPNKLNAQHSIDIFFKALCSPAKKLTLLLTCSSCILLGIILENANPIKPNPEIAPTDAIAYVEQEKIAGNVVNSYIFGGYLIFKNIPVFIDGRADLHGGPDVNDYYQITESADFKKIANLLDKNKINWAIFAPTDKALIYFDTQPGWKKVYEDEYALVYVRKT